MAKNFKFSGKRVTLANAAAARESGALIREDGFVGVALKQVASGQSLSLALEGVWGLTYADYAGLGAATISVGTILYWDTSAAKLSIGSANDDYAAVKVVDTGTLTTDGAFQGLLLPQGKPVGQDQS